MRRGLALCGAIAAALACAPSGPGGRVAPASLSPIDTLTIRGHTRFLSDDALAGRATGTGGADLAALYIASACIGMGLAPLQGSYLQSVSLEAARIQAPGTELTLTGLDGTRRFEYRRGFVPDAELEGPSGFAGPAVYLGARDEILGGGGGAAAADLKGAVAVTTGAISDAAAARLKSFGVVGLVQLTSDQAQYLLYIRSRGDSRLRLADTTIKTSFGSVLPSVVASPDLSRRLLAGALPAQGTTTGSTRLVDSVTVVVRAERRAVQSNNVACLLPGSDPKLSDTAVVYTAHYDHLGIGVPDARGDSIYNGFSDNAAGVAMLLAIADALSIHGSARTRHSVLLLFCTGEEEGLLGSDYYVAKPLWPLSRVRGVINLDAGAPPARPWSWRIAGADRSEPLARLAQDVAADRGWSATTSPATPNSDYYPFARSGVPAIFIVPGTAPYQGVSADSSQALRRRWEHYHEPSDEWSPDFPFAGLGRYAEYAYYIGRALDGSTAPLRRATARGQP